MKALRSAVVALLVGATMLSLAGCAKKIEPVKKKDFKNALETVFDLDDDEYADGADTVAYMEGKYLVMLHVYDDADDAEDWFEDMYDDFQDAIDDKDFEGKHREVYNEDNGYGYILIDGESDSENEFFSDGYMYGGIFWADDTAMMVITSSDKDKYINGINDFLRELGYPRP